MVNNRRQESLNQIRKSFAPYCGGPAEGLDLRPFHGRLPDLHADATQLATGNRLSGLLQPPTHPHPPFQSPSIFHAAMFHPRSTHFIHVPSILHPSSIYYLLFLPPHFPYSVNQFSVHCHCPSIFHLMSINFPSMFHQSISIHISLSPAWTTSPASLASSA